MPEQKKFPQLVREASERYESLEDMGDVVGVRGQSISNYIAGAVPQKDKWEGLAKALNMKVEELAPIIKAWQKEKTADRTGVSPQAKEVDPVGNAALVITNPQTGEPWIVFDIELSFRGRVVSTMKMGAGLGRAQLKIKGDLEGQ